MTLRASLRFAAPALACLLFAGGALGQTPAPAPTAAAPAPSLPVITPSHLAAARAVVEASGLAKSFGPVIPQLMTELDITVTRTRPELAADLKAVLDQLQPEFVARNNELIDNAARAVATDIGEADLTLIAAFFNSPAGKKYVATEPDMLSRMMETTHVLTAQMSEEMMTRVRVEMKKRGKQM